MTLSDYPKLKGVVESMAQANGMVNRVESTEQLYYAADRAIQADGVLTEDVVRLETWLATLTTYQLETLADGEETERCTLLCESPKGATDAYVAGLLDDIYAELEAISVRI